MNLIDPGTKKTGTETTDTFTRITSSYGPRNSTGTNPHIGIDYGIKRTDSSYDKGHAVEAGKITKIQLSKNFSYLTVGNWRYLHIEDYRTHDDNFRVYTKDEDTCECEVINNETKKCLKYKKFLDTTIVLQTDSGANAYSRKEFQFCDPISNKTKVEAKESVEQGAWVFVPHKYKDIARDTKMKTGGESHYVCNGTCILSHLHIDSGNDGTINPLCEIAHYKNGNQQPATVQKEWNNVKLTDILLVNKSSKAEFCTSQSSEYADCSKNIIYKDTVMQMFVDSYGINGAGNKNLDKARFLIKRMGVDNEYKIFEDEWYFQNEQHAGFPTTKDKRIGSKHKVIMESGEWSSNDGISVTVHERKDKGVYPTSPTSKTGIMYFKEPFNTRREKGSNTKDAKVNSNAKWGDGKYAFRFEAENLQKSGQPRVIAKYPKENDPEMIKIIDNFPPYVEEVKGYYKGMLFYHYKWEVGESTRLDFNDKINMPIMWDEGNITINVRYSEPMKEAGFKYAAGNKSIGQIQHKTEEEMGEYGKQEVTFTIDNLGADWEGGKIQLSLYGKDLADNLLDTNPATTTVRCHKAQTGCKEDSNKRWWKYEDGGFDYDRTPEYDTHHVLNDFPPIVWKVSASSRQTIYDVEWEPNYEMVRMELKHKTALPILRREPGHIALNVTFSKAVNKAECWYKYINDGQQYRKCGESGEAFNRKYTWLIDMSAWPGEKIELMFKGYDRDGNGVDTEPKTVTKRCVEGETHCAAFKDNNNNLTIFWNRPPEKDPDMRRYDQSKDDMSDYDIKHVINEHPPIVKKVKAKIGQEDIYEVKWEAVSGKNRLNLFFKLDKPIEKKAGVDVRTIDLKVYFSDPLKNVAGQYKFVDGEWKNLIMNLPVGKEWDTYVAQIPLGAGWPGDKIELRFSAIDLDNNTIDSVPMTASHRCDLDTDYTLGCADIGGKFWTTAPDRSYDQGTDGYHTINDFKPILKKISITQIDMSAYEKRYCVSWQDDEDPRHMEEERCDGVGIPIPLKPGSILIDIEFSEPMALQHRPNLKLRFPADKEGNRPQNYESTLNWNDDLHVKVIAPVPDSVLTEEFRYEGEVLAIEISGVKDLGGNDLDGVARTKAIKKLKIENGKLSWDGFENVPDEYHKIQLDTMRPCIRLASVSETCERMPVFNGEYGVVGKASFKFNEIMRPFLVAKNFLQVNRFTLPALKDKYKVHDIQETINGVYGVIRIEADIYDVGCKEKVEFDASVHQSYAVDRAGNKLCWSCSERDVCYDNPERQDEKLAFMHEMKEASCAGGCTRDKKLPPVAEKPVKDLIRSLQGGLGGLLPPNRDNPDDSETILIPDYGALDNLTESEHARFAILENGFSDYTASWLKKFGYEYRFVDFTVSPSKLYEESPTLFVPSGGFYGLSNSETLKNMLDEYIRLGGVVFVFSQQKGEDFRPLPGDLQVYGWDEDQSCQSASSYVNEYHEMLSGLSKVSNDYYSIQLDGFILEYPSDGKLLMSRRVGNYGSLVVYPHGNGTVIVTTAYTDWANGLGALKEHEIEFSRGLLAWLEYPVDLPAYNLDDPINQQYEFCNKSDSAADNVVLRLWSPLKDEASTTVEHLSPAMQSGECRTNYYEGTASLPLGIWKFGYALNDADGETIQKEEIAQRFVVTTLENNQSQKDISVAVTTPAMRVLKGRDLDYTFHVKNQGVEPRTIRIGYWDGNEPNQFEGPCCNTFVDIDVPAGEEKTHVYSKYIKPNASRLLFPFHYYDEENVLIGKYSKLNYITEINLNTICNTNKTLYYPGEEVVVNYLIYNTTEYPTTANLKIDFEIGPSITQEYSADAMIIDGHEDKIGTWSFVIPTGEEAYQGNNRGTVKCTLDYEKALTTSKRSSVSAFVIDYPMQYSHVTIDADNTNAIPRLTYKYHNDFQGHDLENLEFLGYVETPSGILEAEPTEQFDMPVGSAPKVFEYDIDLRPLQEGIYYASYSLTYQNRVALQGKYPMLSRVAVSSQTDKSYYKVGETVAVRVKARNQGFFHEDIAVKVEFPITGDVFTDFLTLEPNDLYENTFSIAIPVDSSAGDYDVKIEVIKGETKKTYDRRFVIQSSQFNLGLDKNEYVAGESPLFYAENTGGTPTSHNCTIRLFDFSVKDPVYTRYFNGAIGPEEKKYMVGPLPNLLLNGSYSFKAECQDAGTGNNYELVRIITLSGALNIGNMTLDAATNKTVYLTTEDITTTTTLKNVPTSLMSSKLDLKILKAKYGWERWEHYSSEEGTLPQEGWVWDIAASGDMANDGKDIWVALNVGGVFPAPTNGGLGRLNTETKEWTIFDSHNSDLVTSNVLAVAVDGDWIWAGGWHEGSQYAEGGVSRLNKTTGEWQNFGPLDGLLVPYVRDIIVNAEDDEVWVGTAMPIQTPGGGAPDGIYRYHKAFNVWDRIPLGDIGLTDQNGVVAMAQDENYIWVATAWAQECGIARYEKSSKTWKAFCNSDYMVYNHAGLLTDISIDDQRRVWFSIDGLGFPEGGGFLVYYYDYDKWSYVNKDYARLYNPYLDVHHYKTWSEPKLLSNDIKSVTATENDVWLATPAGLSRFNLINFIDYISNEELAASWTPWTNYTKANSELTVAPYIVRSIGDSLWIGGYRGVFLEQTESQTYESHWISGIDVLHRGATYEVIKEASVSPIWQGSSTHLKDFTPITEAGNYLFRSTLLSLANQRIKQDEKTFYVTDNDVLLTLETDKKLYRQNETAQITLKLENTGSTDEPALKLRGAIEEVQAYQEEPFSLHAGEVKTFTWTAAESKSFFVSASVYRVEETESQIAVAGQTVDVSEPSVRLDVDVPSVVGRSPFAAQIVVLNDSQYAENLTLTIQESEQYSFSLAPNESFAVSKSFQTNQDMLLVVEVSDDAPAIFRKLIKYGESATLEVSPQEVYPEGTIDVPFTLINDGILPTQIDAVFSMDDFSDDNRSYFLNLGSSQNDYLLYDLTEGDYLLNYVYDFGEQNIFIKVRKFNTSEIVATNQHATGETILVFFDVKNTGPNRFAGSLSLTLPFFYSSMDVELEMGEVKTYQFTVPADVVAGVYDGKAILWHSGLSIDETAIIVTIPRPVFILDPIPQGWVFDAGVFVDNMILPIKNVGLINGEVKVSFRAVALIEDTIEAWVEAGETSDIEFGMYIPEDFIDGDYYAVVTINDVEWDIPFHINGAKIDVVTTLDKQIYMDGETVRFNIDVINTSEMPLLEIFARVDYADYSETKEISLATNGSLQFEFDAVFDAAPVINYGVYMQSGRAIHIGAKPIRMAKTNFVLSSDKNSYFVDETIVITVETENSGHLELRVFTEVFTLDLPKGVSSINIQVPHVREDVYPIYYNFHDTASSETVYSLYPITVLGVFGKIVEAKLDKYVISPSDELMLDLIYELNTAIDGIVIIDVYDPDWGLIYSNSFFEDVTKGRNRYSSNIRFDEELLAGNYAVSYRIYERTHHIFIAGGYERFEVAGSKILSLATNKREYPLGIDPVIIYISLYGYGESDLVIALNEETFIQEHVSLSGYHDMSYQLSNITPGEYIVSGVLTSTISESRKHDYFIYGSSLPDLAIDDKNITLDTSDMIDGYKGRLKTTVKNIGRSDAGPFNVGFYLGKPEEGGSLLGVATMLSGLAASDSVLIEMPISLLEIPGQQTIFAISDILDEVYEYDETNNVASSVVFVPSLITMARLGNFTNPESTEISISDQYAIFVLGSYGQVINAKLLNANTNSTIVDNITLVQTSTPGQYIYLGTLASITDESGAMASSLKIIVTNDGFMSYIVESDDILTVVYDNEPPVTIVYGIPETTVTHDVEIGFEAHDNLSGIKAIYYCLDTIICDPTTEVIGGEDIIVSNTGTSYICYRSEDNAGNMEDVRCSIVTIEKITITDGKPISISITPYQELMMNYKVTNLTHSVVSEGIITGKIVSLDDPLEPPLATFSERVTKYGTTIAPGEFLLMTSAFTPVVAREDGVYRIILYYQEDELSQPQQAYTTDIMVEGCR
ncbi:MAG TPA: CARDB domain-containing protein [bacterium]|nr:CARDB domain-containing protein [bacterium]